MLSTTLSEWPSCVPARKWVSDLWPRLVAETAATAGRDAEGERRTTARLWWEDGAIDVAEAVEDRETLLGGLPAAVDEGHKLSGRGNVAAAENPRAGPVTGAEAPRIDD